MSTLLGAGNTSIQVINWSDSMFTERSITEVGLCTCPLNEEASQNQAEFPSCSSSNNNNDGDRDKTIVFIYLLLCNTLMYFEAGSVPAMLLHIAHSFNMSPGSQGLLGGIVYLSMCFGGPVAGYWFARGR